MCSQLLAAAAAAAAKSLQSCPTLYDPIDGSPPGSSIHRTLVKCSHPRLLRWLPWWLSGEESTCQCRGPRFYPWVGKIPWRRKWQPTPVFLPGKSNRQRSLAGYSPWGVERVRHDLATKPPLQVIFMTQGSNLHLLCFNSCGK